MKKWVKIRTVFFIVLIVMVFSLGFISNYLCYFIIEVHHYREIVRKINAVDTLLKERKGK